MSFLRFWPIALGISIPALILLYMLKRKTKEIYVPSSMLWNEIYKNTQANTPWEKFKNNIMLILQLIVLTCIILALMNPFLNFGGKSYKNSIIVIDNSASMSTEYEGKTRLEKSKEIAKEYINSSKEGTNGYIISANKDVTLEISASNDKSELSRMIDNINQTYLPGDISESLSLVKSIGEAIGEEYEVVFVTDKQVDIGEVNGRVITLSNSGVNASVDSISHKITEAGMKVIANVTNRGEGNYSGDFSLFGENELLDVKSIDLAQGDTITLYFDINNFTGEYLIGELSTKDMIQDDNVYYDIVKGAEIKKVLLVTESNVFLEKALSTLANIELYKTNSVDNINPQDKYDLYVFDGEAPEILPSTGNILFINSTTEGIFSFVNDIESSEAVGVKDNLSKYLSNISFGVSKSMEIEIPYWGEKLLEIDGKTIAFIGENNGRGIGAIGFDLYNSDFVLKSDFPVFIHFLSDKLLKTGMVSVNNFIGGDEILINSSGLSSEVKIKANTGKTVDFSGGEFKSWKDLGVYTLEENGEEENRKEIIAINFPTREESNTSVESIGEENQIKTSKGIKRGLNLTPILILLVIIVVSVEWYLYKKGY